PGQGRNRRPGRAGGRRARAAQPGAHLWPRRGSGGRIRRCRAAWGGRGRGHGHGSSHGSPHGLGGRGLPAAREGPRPSRRAAAAPAPGAHDRGTLCQVHGPRQEGFFHEAAGSAHAVGWPRLPARGARGARGPLAPVQPGAPGRPGDGDHLPQGLPRAGRGHGKRAAEAEARGARVSRGLRGRRVCHARVGRERVRDGARAPGRQPHIGAGPSPSRSVGQGRVGCGGSRAGGAGHGRGAQRGSGGSAGGARPGHALPGGLDFDPGAGASRGLSSPQAGRGGGWVRQGLPGLAGTRVRGRAAGRGLGRGALPARRRTRLRPGRRSRFPHGAGAAPGGPRALGRGSP
ncbi:hypothetical protein H632_c2867p0, partial [Helicosporidium sp. ATCC 50920]